MLGCSLASALNAAPPRCETQERDGTTFEVCTQADVNCESLAREQVRQPSDKWNGCALGATIIKSYFIVLGVSMPTTHVSIVPSYVDSEKVDMKVTVEQSGHKFTEHVFKDIPVIIRDNIPTASITLGTPQYPVGVPTVEATEKGGKQEASHSYK